MIMRYPTTKGREAPEDVRCWSSCDEILHIQRQKNPSKTVGGANVHLESNPIPARDAQRVQTNLVHTRMQRPHRD